MDALAKLDRLAHIFVLLFLLRVQVGYLLVEVLAEVPKFSQSVGVSERV